MLQEGDGRQLTLLQSMGSGFSAACLGPVATGPFDVIKVRLLGLARHCCTPGSHQLETLCCVQTRLMAQEKGEGPVRYRGLWHALMTIPREEGIRAMYKGLLPRLLRIPPGQAIVWAVSDQITGSFERRTKDEILAS